jgi:hypothetical protein
VLAALSDPLTSGLKRYKRREKYRMKSIENKLSGTVLYEKQQKQYERCRKQYEKYRKQYGK